LLFRNLFIDYLHHSHLLFNCSEQCLNQRETKVAQRFDYKAYDTNATVV